MRTLPITITAILAALNIASSDTSRAAQADSVQPAPLAANAMAPVRALIARLAPVHAQNFAVEPIAAEGGRNVFEIENRTGKIVLRGDSPLSAAVALNWYLKYYCHCSVSLNGRNLELPVPLPTVARKVRQTGWASSRYLLNYCTFGYSMPWWDWTQWEAFIDWMALNGVNMPLAVTGQEAVWQAVGRRFGMNDGEIEAFLPGPPYLPFGWMGCLDGWGGPLPKDWIPRHADLERRILARERELGITPVLQGFTGHVPESLLKKFPGTKAQRIHWIEFDTWMLDPQDPLFQKLGTAFIEEQTKFFGTDHLYAADSFIEMRPPSGELPALARTGRAIYEGMAGADPKAVWLLQGWTFMNQAAFWQPDRVRAFLDAVPDDHMLLLDLYCERSPVWNKTQGFHGKPWVWSFVYNFGNRPILGSSGPLQRFNDLARARADPLGRNLRGVGLMMEGFGHNPPIFDLMFELAWRDDVELKSWMADFARYRYGKENADAQAAWETLRTALYNRTASEHAIVTAFPAAGCGYARYPAPALARACGLLLQAQRELGPIQTYRHDLVNVARQALSNRAAEPYQKAMAAFAAKDAAAFRAASGEFLQLLRDLDELLATSDEFLLGSWLEDAKRWGATDEERVKLEWNARRVLTLWGSGERLRDYAWKEWSGLLSGFYEKRWGIFFQRQQQSLDSGHPFDSDACHAELLRFEDEWAGRRETYPSVPRGDSVAVAQRLFDKYLAGSPGATNLTTGKPAACSFSLPGMDAELANDGIVDTETSNSANTGRHLVEVMAYGE